MENFDEYSVCLSEMSIVLKKDVKILFLLINLSLKCNICVSSSVHHVPSPSWLQQHHCHHQQWLTIYRHHHGCSSTWPAAQPPHLPLQAPLTPPSVGPGAGNGRRRGLWSGGWVVTWPHLPSHTTHPPPAHRSHAHPLLSPSPPPAHPSFS